MPFLEWSRMPKSGPEICKSVWDIFESITTDQPTLTSNLTCHVQTRIIIIRHSLAPKETKEDSARTNGGPSLQMVRLVLCSLKGAQGTWTGPVYGKLQGFLLVPFGLQIQRSFHGPRSVRSLFRGIICCESKHATCDACGSTQVGVQTPEIFISHQAANPIHQPKGTR